MTRLQQIDLLRENIQVMIDRKNDLIYSQNLVKRNRWLDDASRTDLTRFCWRIGKNNALYENLKILILAGIDTQIQALEDVIRRENDSLDILIQEANR